MKTTDELWSQTHRALCAGDWGRARALLDALCQRVDNSYELASAQSYGVPASYRQVIDRINVVNRAVNRAC